MNSVGVSQGKFYGIIASTGFLVASIIVMISLIGGSAPDDFFAFWHESLILMPTLLIVLLWLLLQILLNANVVPEAGSTAA